ncbi:molybdenum cofactor biosynthesis protein MoeA [Gottschalkia acidurici 9a]|uniref:Molybdopterin molybdenumtransferase n=1 Tax=Gottschalkia acidurici (strain ATCC 7906 / DSM 604 / BCRC 14475 / CIP 104303 / KCTC 5404 / NCIMB 10678 / 9a) TaxID=1128398 RepID=K0B4U4_GOTA9|nr:gephyrin-like molybdotransferase Glp [Gottschalkia acidurici]AFS79895.1 molybdenum cofactor biosynthesis protein MoeA [Gottschalkia acidurici 9a]
MDFFNVVSVEEARKLLLENINLELESEYVDILSSADRILCDDIISEENVPGFDRSTVDGYAIKSSDSHGASESLPSFLSLNGEIRMGKEAVTEIHPGEAIYVPTGGMLPKGADGVIMIEHVEKMDEENILIYKPISFGENVIFKDDDIKIGQVALEKGKKITPQDIGVLASLGIFKVKVYKKLKFYIISTGDEIIDLDEEMKIGKIRDINSYVLYSMIQKIGGEVVNRTIVKDNFELLKQEVENGLEDSDIVILSGGSSVGVRDFTHQVIDSFEGKGVFIHGMSIKPGKPTIIGEARGKGVFGLPGHPVSSIIVFKALVERFIKDIMGVKEGKDRVKAIVDFNFPSSSGKTTYQMVSLEERDGKVYCIPNFGKSGMITLLSQSSGYIEIQSHEEGIYKGEERDVYLL